MLEKLGQALQGEIWKPGVGEEGWSLPAIQGHCEGGSRGLWGMLWGKQGKEDNPLSLVEKPFYFRDQSCLPQLFNRLPGITCGVMVKAAPKSLPTAAGAGGPLPCYSLYIRQHSHYRCHQMTLNHKNINTHQDGKATTNCLGHAPSSQGSRELPLGWVLLSCSTRHRRTRKESCVCSPLSSSSNDSLLWQQSHTCKTTNPNLEIKRIIA